MNTKATRIIKIDIKDINNLIEIKKLIDIEKQKILETIKEKINKS